LGDFQKRKESSGEQKRAEEWLDADDADNEDNANNAGKCIENLFPEKKYC
jgi:hypothetical protein